MSHLTHPQGPLCKWKGFLGPSFRNFWAVRSSRHKQKWWCVPLCSVECPDAWCESGGHGHRDCATPWQLRATSDLCSQSDTFLVWQHDCGRIQSAVSFRCSPIATEVRTESPKEWGKQASSITQLGQILTVACGNRDTAMGLAGSLYFSSCLSSHPERDILAVGFHFNEVSYLGEYIFVISIKM